MKRNMFYAWLGYFMVVITASQFVVSCNNKPEAKPEDSSQVAEKENDAKFENKKLEKDAQFLVDAADFNLEEIRLGNLVQQRSSTPEVKSLAKMMVEEHTKVLKEVSDMAKTKQVSLPDSINSSAQQTYETLSAKSAGDFNKAYCERMVEAHKEIIGKFEKESADSRDQDLKQWATAKLPELRKHLDHVFDIQKKIEKQ